VQVFSAKPPFDPLAVLETGPITNHVNFATNRNSTFAYVTVGGLNQVKVYRRHGAHPELVTTIPVGPLPHGVWHSGDGTRVYIALESGGAVQTIDTIENRVIAHIPIGQTAQALVCVPNAVPNGSDTQNLQPLGEAWERRQRRGHGITAGGGCWRERSQGGGAKRPCILPIRHCEPARICWGCGNSCVSRHASLAGGSTSDLR
jgi:hypothetical protein